MTGYDLLCYFITHFKELTKEERRRGYDATFDALQKHFRMRHPYWKLKRRMLALFEAATAQSVAHAWAPQSKEKEHLLWEYDQVDEDIKAGLSFLAKRANDTLNR